MALSEWPFGRAEIEDLLRRRHLECIPASTENANLLLAKARQHLVSAAGLAQTDPELAADALHLANRKAFEAVLLDQGLRPTRDGGHIAPYEAVRAQLRVDARRPRPELTVYDVVRRLRQGADYASYELDITTADITENLPDCERLVGICEKIVGNMPVFRPSQ